MTILSNDGLRTGKIRNCASRRWRKWKYSTCAFRITVALFDPRVSGDYHPGKQPPSLLHGLNTCVTPWMIRNRQMRGSILLSAYRISSLTAMRSFRFIVTSSTSASQAQQSPPTRNSISITYWTTQKMRPGYGSPSGISRIAIRLWPEHCISKVNATCPIRLW